MFNFTLFQREFKSNLNILIIFMAILSMYGIILISMFDPKLGDSLNIMAQSMPEMFKLFGMNNFSTELMDFLINYLYSFLLIVLPLVFIILLVNKLTIKYIDNCSIAYLIATPNSRIKIISTQIITAFIEILILNIYITILYIIISELMFRGELNIIKMIIINFSLFSLWYALLGICFLSSVLFKSTSLSLWVGASVCIISILFQMLSRINDKANIFKYISIISLFNPLEYSNNKNIFIIGTVILFFIGIVTSIITIIIFNKKDIYA